MGNEVMPEYIADQGMYYSSAAAAAPNVYAYYCTGLESPGQLDDHQRFYGIDGQDPHYSGIQTENLPIVYYTPSYEYTQSLYNNFNTCNPCVPGAVIGIDSPFAGTQQYFTNAGYQQPVSSPTFFPAIVHSGANPVANAAPGPLVFNTVASGAGGVDAVGIKFTPPASVGIVSSMQQSDLVTLVPESPQVPLNQLHPLCRVQKGFQVDATQIKQHASDWPMTPSGAPLITQTPDQFKAENVHSVLRPLKATAPAYNGSGDLGSSLFTKATMDGIRPRLQSPGFLNNGNGSSGMLVEQNRGPRMDRSKGSWKLLVVKAYTTKAGAYNAQGNVTIYRDQYNREDFPVNYPEAKFFVIKSYSEDDVHKSIKYGMWSSTPSGNKRLDSAYEEAQRLSGVNTRKCPVFLFFSVNGSGQFCGVAEMISPVDFNRDMDFWQQDKWAGSFPVKWHIIKDVPNSSFRHIILENNENKPVTNSRDTQEVKYMPGLSMLNIFKNVPSRASILDDFMYYEERQRIMFEEKSRLTGISHGSNLFLPAFSPTKSGVTIKHPLKTEERPAEAEDYMKNRSSVTIKHSLKTEEKPAKADDIPGVADPTDEKVASKVEHDGEANDKAPAVSEVSRDSGGDTSVMKLRSLSLDSRGELDHTPTSTLTAETAEYVTVGSMPIKVDGYKETYSGILTVGTIPIHPKAEKQKPLNGVSASDTTIKSNGVLKTT